MKRFVAVLMLAGGLLESSWVYALTSVTTTVTTSSPTFNAASSPLGGITGCGIIPGSHRYATQTFQAQTTASTVLDTQSLSGSAFSGDNFLALYNGTFDPQNPTTNLVACDDDSGPGAYSTITYGLTAGNNYTLVMTSL